MKSDEEYYEKQGNWDFSDIHIIEEYQNNWEMYDEIAISDIDYQNIKKAGFKDVEMVKIYATEYYETADDLLKLLLKTPILDDFSAIGKCEYIHRNEVEKELFDEYVKNNTTSKGIVLKRRYYGIVAKK